MKGLLKTAVLLATFCATAMACGGGGEDALDQKGGDGGGTGNKGCLLYTSDAADE